ncbi:alanine racemase [Candidatus Palauibacter sp.]|uniref:alanine racemase n=1 Tax=Candidatus Palauibacter sp. TaxID=3101350 RepID=UPI003B5172DE
MTRSREPPYRAWLEVDLGALSRNARRVAEHVAPARFVPMVKADAYGLGAIEVARVLDRLEPYALGVATPPEGAELRRGGIERRIVVFAPSAAAEISQLLEARLECAALSLASLAKLEAGARAGCTRMAVHLEVDTGMGRAGLPVADAGAWSPEVASILSRGGASLASVFTHFHSAGTDPAATRLQLARLRRAASTLEEAGVEVPFLHAANSDAVMADPQYHLGLVRPGIYLYGGRRGTGAGGALADPESVARVRARVLEVRDLAPGSTVSYGATYTTGDVERLATLGIGYADGLPWRLSNRGQALIHGVRVPIRGGVCMDVTSVDVSGVSGVEAADVATLLGRDGREEVALADFAETAGTIEYEVLTAIGRRLPRHYVGGPADAADGSR